ncbi:uncharacterized protein LOC122672177 [Telopea speciosissima]|uniref:uncharacterized protein LOC122672177 n=1 Tax=Telopea speciosissima TaxID=54955 RepID=UPI001CC6691D|nr:uncharacterized protein LOC122672177 [Telopea speciosissima]
MTNGDLFPDEDLACIEEEECKDCWQLYFDGAANQRGYGAKILLITLEDLYLPSTFRLEFLCTNNIIEYEACVIGLEAAMALEIKKLKVYRDSSIVICQTQGKWKTKDEKLKSYQEYLEGIAKNFEEITFEYVPRVNNKFIDALVILASMVECSSDTRIRPFLVDQRCELAYEESVNVLTTDGKIWFAPIIDFIRERRYLEHFTVGEKKQLRKYATQFMLQGDLLYKRFYNGIQLLCVNEAQAQTI